MSRSHTLKRSSPFAFVVFILLILLLLQIFPNCSTPPATLAMLLWISLLLSFSSVSRLHRYTHSEIIRLHYTFIMSSPGIKGVQYVYCMMPRCLVVKIGGSKRNVNSTKRHAN